MARLADGGAHRHAEDGGRVAPARIPSILDVEERHRTGRPGVAHDVRALIPELATANPVLRQNLATAVGPSA